MIFIHDYLLHADIPLTWFPDRVLHGVAILFPSGPGIVEIHGDGMMIHISCDVNCPSEMMPIFCPRKINALKLLSTVNVTVRLHWIIPSVALPPPALAKAVKHIVQDIYTTSGSLSIPVGSPTQAQTLLWLHVTTLNSALSVRLNNIGLVDTRPAVDLTGPAYLTELDIPLPQRAAIELSVPSGALDCTVAYAIAMED